MACRQLTDAPSMGLLRELLIGSPAKHIFFDIDETIVMPDTPFIYGMPKSDAFLSALGPCERRVMSDLAQRMEAAYYAAPLTLVDAGLPSLISELQNAGKQVLALTSRGMGDAYDWHTELVVDFLAAVGIRLSALPPGAHDVGNDTPAGGILFADGKDKGAIIERVVPLDGLKILVDNTRSKLTKALANVHLCLQGIHFTAAEAREHADTSRRHWVRQELADLGVQCTNCAEFRELRVQGDEAEGHTLGSGHSELAAGSKHGWRNPGG